MASSDGATAPGRGLLEQIVARLFGAAGSGDAGADAAARPAVVVGAAWPAERRRQHTAGRHRHRSRSRRRGGLGGFGGLEGDRALAEQLHLEEEERAGVAGSRRGLNPAQQWLLRTDRDLTGDDYAWLGQLDEEPAQGDAGGASSSGGAAVSEQRQLELATAESLISQLLSQLPTHDVPEGCDRLGQCSICCEAMGPGSEVRTLPCMHFFHSACIDQWLKAKPSPRCPQCQKEVVLPE